MKILGTKSKEELKRFEAGLRKETTDKIKHMLSAGYRGVEYQALRRELYRRKAKLYDELAKTLDKKENYVKH